LIADHVWWKWRLVDGSRGAAKVSVSGARRQFIQIEVKGAIWIRHNRVTGETQVQAGAREMWWAGAGTEGWRCWLERWLRSLEIMAGIEATGPMREATDARDGWKPGERWRVTTLEVCADFVGWAWALADLRAVVGARKVGGWGVWCPATVAEGDTERTQTIAIGKRTTAPHSVCLYDKSDEMTGDKSDIYIKVHEQHGWRQGERIMRVEHRLRGPALEYSGKESGELLSVRDPVAVIRELPRLWRLLCHKKRLVVPSQATRLHRCPLDPRWSIVSEAAAAGECDEDWKQARIPQVHAHAERLRRAKRAVVRAATHVVVLSGGRPSAGSLRLACEVISNDAPGMYGDILVAAYPYAIQQWTELTDEMRIAAERWERRTARPAGADAVARIRNEIEAFEAASAVRAQRQREYRAARGRDTFTSKAERARREREELTAVESAISMITSRLHIVAPDVAAQVLEAAQRAYREDDGLDAVTQLLEWVGERWSEAIPDLLVDVDLLSGPARLEMCRRKFGAADKTGDG
jgi:hypothetical protein